jgi:hypothetical protein
MYVHLIEINGADFLQITIGKLKFQYAVYNHELKNLIASATIFGEHFVI